MLNVGGGPQILILPPLEVQEIRGKKGNPDMGAPKRKKRTREREFQKRFLTGRSQTLKMGNGYN